MILAAEVDEFIEAMAPRYAESSLSIQRTNLKSFQAFCGKSQVTEVAAVTGLEFSRYEAWLRCQRLSENTIYAKMRTVKTFLLWAYRAKRTLLDPSAYKLPPRHHRGSLRVPSTEVLKKLLELPDRSTPLGLRTCLVLELLYVLGLRSCECYRLNVSDLDLCKETVRVLGKGQVMRELPLSPRILETVHQYLAQARTLLRAGPEEEALLLSMWGKRLSQQSILITVREYGRKLRLKLHPHLLRHYCATHLLEGGMALEMVQQFLGHAYLDTTKDYVHVRYRELERTFFRTHPRALFERASGRGHH